MTGGRWRVTEPGVVDGMPEDIYHADPVPEGSLSSTGARDLLPPSCPALFKYRREHPVIKKEFDFGSAAHMMVLHAGPPIQVIEADNWRSPATREKGDAARAAGFIPLLRKEMRQVEDMAAAIHDNELARQLLDPSTGGKAEQSLFWIDDEFKVWCRARLDWLSGYRITSTGQLIVSDYKTVPAPHGADPETFARKSATEYGYNQQGAFYIEAVRALLGEDPAFWFICQMKAPPYLVSVVELAPEDYRAGHDRNREALERFRDCSASGIWPGYPPYAVTVAMPPWARDRGEDHYI